MSSQAAVDLGLVDGLRLVEHTGRVEGVAPRTLEQLGRLEHDRGAVFPGDLGPFAPRLLRCLHGLLDFGFAGLVVCAEDVSVVVRADRLCGVAGAHFLAADDEGDLDLVGEHLFEFGLERRLFGRGGAIGADGFVDRGRDRDDSVGHSNLHDSQFLRHPTDAGGAWYPRGEPGASSIRESAGQPKSASGL